MYCNSKSESLRGKKSLHGSIGALRRQSNCLVFKKQEDRSDKNRKAHET